MPDKASKISLAAIEDTLGRPVERLLDRVQLAKLLKVSPETIDAWGRGGKIPRLKIGQTVRFDWDEVKKAISQPPPADSKSPVPTD